MRHSLMVQAGTAMLAVAMAVPASAGETPLYEPVPDWVERKELPAVDAAVSQGNLTFLLADRQIRMQNGKREHYSVYAYRIDDASLLAKLGNLTTSWNPEKGDFTVHRVAIVRDNTEIDLIENGQRFTILRREANLERLSLDGILTAALQLEGLKVGDTIIFESSTSYTDAALHGNVNDIQTLLNDKMDVKSAGLRFLWPSDLDIKWEAPSVARPVLTKQKGMTELVLQNPQVPDKDVPTDAPARYRLPYMVEVTSFADWQQVSRTADKAYAERAVIESDSELSAIVSKIAASTTDPIARTAAALRVVQDEIRYLFNGMDNGNYTPQTPAQTWSLRYGDCKAKSLLLATMLRDLGITADVMLVNTAIGDGLPDRLPGFSAFDHVIVRAMIDGRDYWLDGTRVGDRLEDLTNTPDYSYALPVSTAGSGLVPIPVRPLGRPAWDIDLAYDAGAGIGLPALFDVSITWRTSSDNQLKISKGAVSEKQYVELLDATIADMVPNTGISSREVSFDEDADTTTIKARGVAWMSWNRIDGRFEREFNSAIKGAKLSVNRTRSEWSDISYAVGDMIYSNYATRILLPQRGKGFAMAGRANLDNHVIGRHYWQTASLDGNRFDAAEYWRTVDREIAAEDLPMARRELAMAKADPLRIEAPEDYPGRRVEAMLAARENRLDALFARLDKAIATAPEDEVSALQARADVYELTHQYDKAIDDLDTIIGIDPSAGYYLWRASLHMMDDDAAAIADIDRAFGVEPDSLVALSLLVDMRMGLEEYEKALVDIDEREALGIDAKEIAALRAQVFAAAGRDDEALAVLDGAGRSAQNSSIILVARCSAGARYELSGEQVLRDCTRAIQRNEQPTTSLIDRGIALARLGRTEEALADFNAALEIDPDLAWAWYLRAVVGKGDTARRDRQYALYIDPDVVEDLAKIGFGS